jgi:hypothetical protein
MMSIPFFLLAIGLVAVSAGNRGAAIGLWTAGLVTVLILFRLHATDTLNIGL